MFPAHIQPTDFTDCSGERKRERERAASWLDPAFWFQFYSDADCLAYVPKQENGVVVPLSGDPP